jgi:hypothetical protein
MRIAADQGDREAGRRFLTGAGVLGAILAAALATAAVPATMLMLVGAEVVAILTLAPAWVFVGATLLVRDVSDSLAEHPVVGTLNSGALLGILVVSVVSLRVLRMRRPIGVAVALGWSVLILAWLAVAYLNFGADPSVTRDLIRILSIVGLALSLRRRETRRHRHRGIAHSSLCRTRASSRGSATTEWHVVARKPRCWSVCNCGRIDAVAAS